MEWLNLQINNFIYIKHIQVIDVSSETGSECVFIY